MVERSQQISSHEEHPEASSSFTSNSPVIQVSAISTWGGYLPQGWVAMSRAGVKPGLMTSQPDKCFSQLSHGLQDSGLLFVLRHCRAFMCKRCETLERWCYFQLLGLPPLCCWIMNAPISSATSIFSKDKVNLRTGSCLPGTSTLQANHPHSTASQQ